MAKEKEEKKEKIVRPLDKEDYSKVMSQVLDQLTMMAGCRDVITEKVNYLNSEYALKKPIVRKAATALFKQMKREELEELNQEVINLMENFKE